MNHMISGDDGSHPSSPYYTGHFDTTCENCGKGADWDDLTDIKYHPADLPEDDDAPPMEVSLCEFCLLKFKNNPKIVIL